MGLEVGLGHLEVLGNLVVGRLDNLEAGRQGNLEADRLGSLEADHQGSPVVGHEDSLVAALQGILVGDHAVSNPQVEGHGGLVAAHPTQVVAHEDTQVEDPSQEAAREVSTRQVAPASADHRAQAPRVRQKDEADAQNFLEAFHHVAVACQDDSHREVAFPSAAVPSMRLVVPSAACLASSRLGDQPSLVPCYRLHQSSACSQRSQRGSSRNPIALQLAGQLDPLTLSLHTPRGRTSRPHVCFCPDAPP